MTAALERIEHARTVDGWRIYGRATIDSRPAARCSLYIGSDGKWSADLSTFTFADTVDLYFESAAGGHFCGPAFVERSRADSDPFQATTVLTGVGPLLVVDPSGVKPELTDEEIVDGEVIE